MACPCQGVKITAIRPRYRLFSKSGSSLLLVFSSAISRNKNSLSKKKNMGEPANVTNLAVSQAYFPSKGVAAKVTFTAVHAPGPWSFQLVRKDTPTGPWTPLPLNRVQITNLISDANIILLDYTVTVGSSYQYAIDVTGPSGDLGKTHSVSITITTPDTNAAPTAGPPFAVQVQHQNQNPGAPKARLSTLAIFGIVLAAVAVVGVGVGVGVSVAKSRKRRAVAV